MICEYLDLEPESSKCENKLYEMQPSKLLKYSS